MPPLRIAATAIAVATLTATGCGGGGSGKALSRSELIAKANVICKRLNGERKSINIKTRQDYIRVLKKFARDEQIAFTELGKLTPPTSLARDWKQLVAGVQTVSKDMTQLVGYMTTYNNRSARILNRSANAVLQTMHAISERDGLTECAQFA
jgi:hypothetical protein